MSYMAKAVTKQNKQSAYEKNAHKAFIIRKLKQEWGNSVHLFKTQVKNTNTPNAGEDEKQQKLLLCQDESKMGEASLQVWQFHTNYSYYTNELSPNIFPKDLQIFHPHKRHKGICNHLIHKLL